MIGIAAEIKKELVLGLLFTHSAQREISDLCGWE
jgi:hypothetical protein